MVTQPTCCALSRTTGSDRSMRCRRAMYSSFSSVIQPFALRILSACKRERVRVRVRERVRVRVRREGEGEDEELG